MNHLKLKKKLTVNNRVNYLLVSEEVDSSNAKYLKALKLKIPIVDGKYMLKELKKALL